MGRRVPATRTPPLEVVTLAPLVLARQLQPRVLDHPHRAVRATRTTAAPAAMEIPAAAATLAMATPTPPLEVVTLAPLVLARQLQPRVLDHPHRAVRATRTTAAPAAMEIPA